MTARKYSIDEIDRMREALRRHGAHESISCYYSNDDGSAAYSIGSLSSEEVEARLRTYMIAGIDPDELERTFARRYDQAIERAAESRRTMQRLMPPKSPLNPQET